MTGLLVGLAGSVGAGCGSGAGEAGGGLPLDGEWVAVGARRGARSTELLDGAYFAFDSSAATVTTNFTGDSLRLGYVRDGDRLATAGGGGVEELVIAERTDSTMTLETEVRSTRFAIYLRRQTRKAQ